MSNLNVNNILPEKAFKNRRRNFLFLYSEFFSRETFDLLERFFQENNITQLKISLFKSINYAEYTPEPKESTIVIKTDDLYDYFFSPIWEDKEREYFLDYCYLESLDNKITFLMDKSKEIVIIGVLDKELDSNFEKILEPYREANLQEKLNYFYDAIFFDKKKGQVFIKNLIKNYFDKEAVYIENQ